MKARKAVSPAASATDEIHALVAGLKHPLKDDIQVVRRVILGVNAAIGEAIKWKAPSFHTREFFATINLRSTDRVQLIFHLGAKVREDVEGMKIADPAGLIKWLAPDRCLVTVGAGKELRTNQSALEAIVRQWITYV